MFWVTFGCRFRWACGAEIRDGSIVARCAAGEYGGPDCLDGPIGGVDGICGWFGDILLILGPIGALSFGPERNA